MKHYFAAPASRMFVDDWGNQATLPTITVFETDRGPRDSGLLNGRGEKLLVTDERHPIGFALHPVKPRGSR